MIGYLLILLFTILNLGESIAVKEYAKRHGSGGMLMNAVIALFSALFFLVTDKGGFYVPEGMLPFALINVCLYAAGFYLTYIAFRIGPYGLTSLISRFSLAITAFYGIIFLKEPISVLTCVGFALIACAMFLINRRGKSDSGEDGCISAKWLICILTSVVANGFIVILTRMQQIRWNDACSNEFQVVSIGGCFILLTILGLITDRDKLSAVLKRGSLYGAAAGIFNGAKNFTTLAIYLYLPISIVGSLQTGLGMVVAYLAAILIYKEKYTLYQKLGVLAGALAVVLLAI